MKSNIINSIKRGDKDLREGSYNNAILHYLEPMNKDGKINLDANHSAYEPISDRLILCLEKMVISKIQPGPIHQNLIKHIFYNSKRNLTSDFQSCGQRIILDSLANLFKKIRTRENLNSDIINDEEIFRKIQNNEPIHLDLHLPSKASNFFKEKIIYDNDFQEIILSPFNLKILERILFYNQAIEIFFSTTRAQILKESLSNLEKLKEEDKIVEFLSKLSLHSFKNQFCWIENKQENINLEKLYQTISKKIESNQSISRLEILILLTYRPISYFKKITKDLLINIDDNFFEEIIVQQIDDIEKEKILQKGIKNLTQIDNEVSNKVRNQYEDNPFPRWDANLKKINTVPYIHVIKSQTHKSFKKIPIKKILVAGCGTGLHPINIALCDPKVSIDAIDLSLNSLAYGKRQAEKMNIKNINWYQADILKLKNHKKNYDVIEASGVLHHMENPEEGFKILANKLNKNGLFKIGLYSKIYRETLINKKKFLKQNKIGISDQSIREARQLLMEKDILMNSDYFSKSQFIDMLLHEQEVSFTIKELINIFSENFQFLGFLFPGQQRNENEKLFRNYYSNTEKIYDIDKWDKIEKENESLFISMYQFWLQKKDNF